MTWWLSEQIQRMAERRERNMNCKCGHTPDDHRIMKPSKKRPGYYRSEELGPCTYAHGIPGRACSCKSFRPSILRTENVI